MRGSIRLFRVFGISINIHVTFILLFVLFLSGGIKWLILMTAVFFFVTLHELCHSLVARRFGIDVKEITLLPIGGVASMSSVPDRPSQEFLISAAGPLFNIIVIIVFYYPMKLFFGAETLFHPLSTATWPLTVVYAYWINLALALFNLIPAFPMDGGRILRALLASRISYLKATKIAVTFGHIFALIFAYFGIMQSNFILVVIAVFIYTSASGEEAQAALKETLKKFTVRDILSHDFVVLDRDATLAKVLELVFRSHQEDFPVIDSGALIGFLTRQDLVGAIRRLGTQEAAVGTVMRTSFPRAKDTDSLHKVQRIMQEHQIKALPVMENDTVIGIVSLEDIGRAYAIASERG